MNDTSKIELEQAHCLLQLVTNFYRPMIVNEIAVIIPINCVEENVDTKLRDSFEITEICSNLKKSLELIPHLYSLFDILQKEKWKRKHDSLTTS